MTVETDEQPRSVRITPRMEDIIRHLLDNPRGKFYGHGICSAMDLPSGTVLPILRRMADAGWIERAGERPRAGSTPAAHLWRFTNGTPRMLRGAINV